MSTQSETINVNVSPASVSMNLINASTLMNAKARIFDVPSRLSASIPQDPTSAFAPKDLNCHETKANASKSKMNVNRLL